MADENVTASCNDVLQTIARHINCLSEENRNTRKRALEGIRKEVILKKPPLEPNVVQEILAEILKPLLKTLSDPVEKCRNLAVDILSNAVKSTSKPDELLSYIIPVLVQRLGQQDVVETSEEVRLQLVVFLHELVHLCKKQTGPYVDDIVKILQRTVVDQYPDVKKESCRCVATYARTVPEQFHMQSESMIQPLLTTISHQHSRVRVEVILAIGIIYNYVSAL